MDFVLDRTMEGRAINSQKEACVYRRRFEILQYASRAFGD